MEKEDPAKTYIDAYTAVETTYEAQFNCLNCGYTGEVYIAKGSNPLLFCEDDRTSGEPDIDNNRFKKIKKAWDDNFK